MEENKPLTGRWSWKRLTVIIAMLMIGLVVFAACGDDDETEEATSATGAATAATGGATTASSGGATTPTSGSAMTPATGAATTPTAAAASTPTTKPATTPTTGGATTEDLEDLEGEINIDGSSTVFPITQAVAEEFNALAPNVQISVGVSGTGGGFEKFCAGETQISDASRPIKDEEAAACEAAGIEYTEITVAIDGLSVIVNPENDWVDCLTVEQLNQIWDEGSTVTNWSDVDPSWPNEPIALYGPGTDSGTFDYFTDEINGDEGRSRADYTASEDDNVLVQGVAGDQYALGYFGYAYYVENQDSLKVLEIDGGEGCVEPTPETVASGEYAPLSRPIFIYVNNEALAEEHVAAFVEFYMSDDGMAVVPEVGYIQLGDEELDKQRSALEEAMQ